MINATNEEMKQLEGKVNHSIQQLHELDSKTDDIIYSNNIIRSLVSRSYLSIIPYVCAAVIFTAPVLRLGPIDYARTAYNQIIGDMPVLRQKLLDYAREGVYEENPSLNAFQIDHALADEIQTRQIVAGKHDASCKMPLDANTLSTELLWDLTEEHAHTLYQRLIWPTLDP